MKLNGAQLTIKLLEQQGITRIAGIPGGASLPLYDALFASDIQHVLTRHEQGAGFIAQGMARVTGKPAVCLASSGPGATNLLTAVADAHLDSIPLIAITGQVAQHLIGTDAFQEVDTFGLMLPITKHNFLVRSATELLEVVPEAFQIACSGRAGPVAIDIPKDVQLEVVDVNQWPLPMTPQAKPDPTAVELEQLRAMIGAAQRPVLMVGGGVVHSNCHRELLQMAESQDLPAVSTFMGLGVVPSDHPLHLGMLGMHGARFTNMILEECDLLIGAGVRFDDRATGKVSGFCPRANIIHIDIDASELGKIKRPSLAIRADIGSTITRYLQQAQPMRRPNWLERVAFLKQRFPLVCSAIGSDVNEEDPFSPYGLLKLLSRTVGDAATIVTDVGQHQMWAAQAFPFRRPRQWISSGGLGTMGFGMPAAIGAALAQPERPVVCISGDGSIMMNIQELDTAAEHSLNIKIVVMNNNNLGLVRQQQSLFYGGRLNATQNKQRLSFAAIAEAMGASGCDLGMSDDPIADLANALQTPGPCLIDVPIAENAMVFPMVPPGAANKNMINEVEEA
ncbi:MAG: biosynthetic-type acetolactate synthase large subunit [Cellvibrionaceae bacterium]